MAKSGKCICGAVRYEIAAEVKEVGACHCGMCQAWSGGVFIGMQAAPKDVTIAGEDALTIYASSPWAERAFCSKCGSSMYYRVTAPGPHLGQYHFGAGTLDDWTGIEMTEAIFIDRKPQGYAFAGTRKEMTEAEVMAMFASPEGAP